MGVSIAFPVLHNLIIAMYKKFVVADHLLNFRPCSGKVHNTGVVLLKVSLLEFSSTTISIY